MNGKHINAQRLLKTRNGSLTGSPAIRLQAHVEKEFCLTAQGEALPVL